MRSRQAAHYPLFAGMSVDLNAVKGLLGQGYTMLSLAQ